MSTSRHTPARLKLIFATHPLADYSHEQVKLAMLIVAHLRRGEFWLIEAPNDA